MTAQDELDGRVRAWLHADAPHGAPPHTMEGVMDRTTALPQHRRTFGGLGGSGRLVAGLAGAAAGIGLATLAIGFVVPRPSGPVATSGPSLAPTASPAPLITMPPATGWQLATSAHGYTVNVPPAWTIVYGDTSWVLGMPIRDDSPWFDRFRSPDGRVEIRGTSTELPSAMTADEWATRYAEETRPCLGGVGWEQFGRWRIREYCGRFAAVTVEGTRGYVIWFRPTGMQPTVDQIAEDRRLFERVVVSWQPVARS